MPKYYIDDGEECVICSEHNPVSACVKSILIGRFSSFMVNGKYRVSELGFEEHESDKLIDSNVINKIVSNLVGFNIEDIAGWYEEDEGRGEK
jgi:hypothetical protein